MIEYKQSPRSFGKSSYARLFLNACLDKDPKAVVAVVSLSGIEYFENAEYEEVTNLIPEQTSHNVPPQNRTE